MFTINFDENELYYINLLNKELTVLIQSEFYETYQECIEFIEEVRKIGQLKSSYLRKTVNNQQYNFIILSSKGSLIACSDSFQCKEDLELCIKEVMELSVNAIIYEIFD